jgi:hypothetical protein
MQTVLRLLFSLFTAKVAFAGFVDALAAANLWPAERTSLARRASFANISLAKMSLPHVSLVNVTWRSNYASCQTVFRRRFLRCLHCHGTFFLRDAIVSPKSRQFSATGVQ